MAIPLLKVSLSYTQPPLSGREKAAKEKRQRARTTLFYCPKHDYVWELSRRYVDEGKEKFRVVFAYTRKILCFYGHPHKKCPECQGKRVRTLINASDC
jgi:hypothetical protein